MLKGNALRSSDLLVTEALRSLKVDLKKIIGLGIAAPGEVDVVSGSKRRLCGVEE